MNTGNVYLFTGCNIEDVLTGEIQQLIHCNSDGDVNFKSAAKEGEPKGEVHLQLKTIAQHLQPIKEFLEIEESNTLVMMFRVTVTIMNSRQLAMIKSCGYTTI
jgi:hypothetical protein